MQPTMLHSVSWRVLTNLQPGTGSRGVGAGGCSRLFERASCLSPGSPHPTRQHRHRASSDLGATCAKSVPGIALPSHRCSSPPRELPLPQQPCVLRDSSFLHAGKEFRFCRAVRPLSNLPNSTGTKKASASIPNHLFQPHVDHHNFSAACQGPSPTACQQRTQDGKMRKKGPTAGRS